jgi:hypothetical protein
MQDRQSGPLPDFATAGGLMTYGASIFDNNRQADWRRPCALMHAN